MNESIKRLHKSRFFRAIFRSFLFGEQEFPILGQRPYFVVYLHLQMVDMIADFIEVRTHFFFVFECPLFLVIFVIGYFSGFGHFAYQYFDGSHPVRDFTNQFFAVSAQYFVFFRREDFFHFAQIL